MFDDFWSGYNYGSKPQGTEQPKQFVKFSESTQREAEQYRQDRQNKVVQQMRPGIYDKSKFTKMQGPQGEQGPQGQQGEKG